MASDRLEIPQFSKETVDRLGNFLKVSPLVSGDVLMGKKEAKKEVAQKRYDNAELEKLACSIANWWLRERVNIQGKIPGPFAEKLEDLERMTRGDPRRCYCLSPDSGHDFQCPARRTDAPRPLF